VDIALADPVSVEGRVVDRTGRPIEGARVVVSNDNPNRRPPDGFPTPRARTDREGRFLLDWLAPGQQELRASVFGQEGLGRASVRILCPPGELTKTELVLDPGLTISGRLVDDGGKPLSDWMVDAIPEPLGSGTRRQARTNGEGRFIVANLDSNYVYTLRPWAQSELASPPRVERAGVEPGSKDVEIVVTASTLADAHVCGRFLDREGHSPSNAQLLYTPEGSRESWFVRVDPRTGAFDQQLRPGRYRLCAGSGGRTLLQTDWFELGAKQTKDMGILALTALGRLELEVSGVPDAERTRLPFLLDREDCGTERLQFDGGMIRSREILPGTWNLSLHGDWILNPRPIEIREGETTRVECAVERGFRISVDILFPDPSAKWTTLTLKALKEQGGAVQSETEWSRIAMHDGRVQVYGLSLPAGTFVLEALTDTGLRASARIEVGPETTSQPTTIVLR
jgi:hypothetical protein